MSALARPALWLLLLAATAPQAAPGEAPTDPLQTAACRQALARLDAAEGAGPPETLAGARRSAARACLGSRADPPPAARREQAPLGLDAPRTTLPPLARPAPPPSVTSGPAAPPVRPAPIAPSITHCDDRGCFASDGVYRPRGGGGLVDPSRGPCTLVGGLLRCP